MSLDTDAPLGAYDVTAYYVTDNKVTGSSSTQFKLQKTGIVESLSTMSAQNAPLYGTISMVIVMSVGLLIGAIFPKARH